MHKLLAILAITISVTACAPTAPAPTPTPTPSPTLEILELIQPPLSCEVEWRPPCAERKVP